VKYEVVIGIEVHTELDTQSKLFCGCSTAFGAPPNTQVCPVCTAQPGSLPVMNRRAFELSLRTAAALHCTIAPRTIFDRKNYYYPDLPKNFQISQLYANLGEDGYVEIDVDGETRRVGIHNVHLEEDAGKLIHPEDAASLVGADGEAPPAGMTLVDLNRTGIPLLEIVTQPDMRCVAEAKAYMDTLLGILRALGVSDCKMQEGSVRFEPSISLRPFGQEELGCRVEIKNVNSISTVVKILEYEVRRQTAALDHGETIARTTSLWDERLERTVPMRSKEAAQDYRYFPEPDLVPIDVGAAWVERVRADLPELPLARRRRFVADLGLPDYDAGVLVEDKALADYFEACVALGTEAKTVSNWLMVTVLRELNTRQIDIAELGVPPERLCELIGLVMDGAIAQNTGKTVFAHMAETGKSAAAIVDEKGLRQVSDAGELEAVVLQILRDNPQAVEDLRAGKKKATGFLMGQIMRATQGKANPQVVSPLIAKLLPDV